MRSFQTCTVLLLHKCWPMMQTSIEQIFVFSSIQYLAFKDASRSPVWTTIEAWVTTFFVPPFELRGHSSSTPDAPQRKWSQGASGWKKRFNRGFNGWKDHFELWLCDKNTITSEVEDPVSKVQKPFFFSCECQKVLVPNMWCVTSKGVKSLEAAACSCAAVPGPPLPGLVWLVASTIH